MGILVYVLINSLAIFIAAQLLTGVHVANFTTAVIVAVVLGAINTFIKPILVLLTLPLRLLSFGLFAFVLNALLVLVVTKIVPGFFVDGFWWALLFSLIISIIASVLHSLFKRD